MLQGAAVAPSNPNHPTELAESRVVPRESRGSNVTHTWSMHVRGTHRATQMGVFTVLGGSSAPHPGAVLTHTVLRDTLGYNTGTTATLHGAPFRRRHWVKVNVGTPMGYPHTGLEIVLAEECFEMILKMRGPTLVAYIGRELL